MMRAVRATGYGARERNVHVPSFPVVRATEG